MYTNDNFFCDQNLLIEKFIFPNFYFNRLSNFLSFIMLSLFQIHEIVNTVFFFNTWAQNTWEISYVLFFSYVIWVDFFVLFRRTMKEICNKIIMSTFWIVGFIFNLLILRWTWTYVIKLCLFLRLVVLKQLCCKL